MEPPPQSKSAPEWASWLAEAERRLREVYKLSPGHLIAEYRRERGITSGYHGREILELLQNAGDAAQQAGQKGRVRIVVNPHGVVVGNTGRPFDTGGVQSLQTANLSPKRQRESAVIGDKGLGFRSILNWTQCPLISSGALGLAFLPSYTAAVVAQLEAECVPIADWIGRERSHAADLIAPRLAFPKWIADWTAGTWEGSEGLKGVAQICHLLRAEGFDTAVGMPFAYPGAHEEALRQVAELGPEILLLVDSLGTLELESNGGDRKTWRREQAENRWTVFENDNALGTWTVFPFEDKVPSSLVDPSEPAQKTFRVTVAVPEQNAPGSRRLCCYFPTEVDLPLPLVCHATVQLDETRKHLNNTQTNRYILQKLAEKIAEIAEWHAGVSGRDSWAGCQLVVPSVAWSGDLLRLGFPDYLKSRAVTRRLIPALDGTHCTAGKARLAPGFNSAWLPVRHFPEVARTGNEQHRRLAQHLDVSPLSPSDIVARLVAAGDLTLEERAQAVVGLLGSGPAAPGMYSAKLLCDEKGAPLAEGTQAIFQPAGPLPEMPNWATIRFLNPTMRTRIGELLRVTESRELQQRLRPFGVIEYSLAALIGPVLAGANRKVREEPEQEQLIRREVLAFLWQVHQGMKNTGQTVAFPADATLKLPSQKGDYRAPGDLYLGDGYGSYGTIIQDLFVGWAKQGLIAPPEQLGLADDPEVLEEFLMWLGVARWPREVPAQRVDPEFVKEIIDGLRYPARFQGSEFANASALVEAQVSPSYFKSIDGIEKILELAPPEAILSWLSRDPRAANWIMPSPDHGKLYAFPPYARAARYWGGPVPSYIRWQISKTDWLPTQLGTLTAPRRCLLGERLIENLFPRPAEPKAELLVRYGMTDIIREGFIAAGVMPGLIHLGRDEIYRLLLEMPGHSPDGKATKALYRWFLEHEADLFGQPGECQQRFFREGRMWGAKGTTQGYFPVSQLRHVDTDGFPAGLMPQLAVVDLPRRVGSDKVDRLFQVKAVERAGVQQELLGHRLSPGHEQLADWFNQAKPYLKRLRRSQTTQSQNLGTLDRLRLCVCDEVQIKLVYDGSIHEYNAAEGEWFIFGDLLYVRGDTEDSLDLLADAVGAAIAALFRLAEGDAFAKLLRCESGSRARLLKRMGGDDFQEEIERAGQLPAYAGPIVAPQKKEPRKAPADSPHEDIPPKEPEDTTPGGASAKEHSPGIKRLEHTPAPPRTARRLVVRKVERPPGKPGVQRQPVDGNLCEQVAMEFEESDDAPRFPLLVGQITGMDAPGCDVLSFASADDRAAFENPVTRDWAKVVRFIEVKGRSSATAKIELKDNELKAARTYHGRYFLYRFYVERPGVYLVSALRDPLGAVEATSTAIHIDLERARSTERYRFGAEG